MLPIITTSMRSMVIRHQLLPEVLRKVHTSVVYDAARKGTREKARKKKVKGEVQKVGFIPHNKREEKINLKRENKHVDDSWKQIPTDNCYVRKYYRWPVYTIAEAIQCHRETFHPTLCDCPNAQLMAHIELNMKGEKSTRFVDNFQRIAMVPHKFVHGEERRILVFRKGNDEILDVGKPGVNLIGGVELIKNITDGKVLLTDYQYILAHPNILPELVSLRGLLKRKFPNPKAETLGPNLSEMIKRFTDGISYSATKDEFQQDFGLITVCVGTLDMHEKQLEENIHGLLQDVNSVRPKREGRFITRVLLKCPPSNEQLKIDPFQIIPEMYEKPRKTSSTEIHTSEDNIDAEEEEIQKPIKALN